MSTTLLNCEIALSRELGDFWSSSTTSNGATTGATLVDTELKAHANDWLTDEASVMLTEEPSGGATSLYAERKTILLDNTSGTLSVIAFGEQIVSGIDYRLHRLFTASEKRRALITAARTIFPACFQEVYNEELVSGNWLQDGSFERWTNSTTPTAWTATTLTATQTTTSPYYKHGATSAKLSTLAGKLTQSITNFDDLKRLQGRQVTLTTQGWCNTANCLRLAIYDGLTRTYSSYHAGDSAWTQDNPRNDSIYVQHFVDYNPTEITFEVYHDVAAGTSYVDDARAISIPRGRLYIGHLGLAQNLPHQIKMEPYYYASEEPWRLVSDWVLDKDGYLYIPTSYIADRRLRIQGIGYLDFLVAGVSSELWTATIALDEPQIKILTAMAAYYLYTWGAMPNYESGRREAFQQAAAFWQGEFARRANQFGMIAPGATINWGLG